MTREELLELVYEWGACCEGLYWLESCELDAEGWPVAPPEKYEAWFGYHAGMHWDDFSWSIPLRRVVDAVCKDSRYAYLAGRDWPVSISGPFGSLLAKGISCCYFAYKAGLDWPAELSQDSGRILVDTIVWNDHFRNLAMSLWPDFLRKEVKMIETYVC